MMIEHLESRLMFGAHANGHKHKPAEPTAAETASSIPGDANFDGAVTTDDYVVIDLNLGRTVAPWSDGDTNGDGLVTTDDYVVVDLNLGRSTYEWTRTPGQSLTGIDPAPGDDVLVSGDWANVFIPSTWSGSRVHFTGTIGGGQSGTVFSASNVELHGLRVANVRNGLQYANAAAKIGSNTKLFDSRIENVTGLGLGMSGSNILVERCAFTRNGQGAWTIQTSNGVTIRDSTWTYDNPGLIDPPWKNQGPIGGYAVVVKIGDKYHVSPDFETTKIWISNNVLIDNCESAYHVGPGIWADNKNTNVTVRNSRIHHNRGLDTSRFYQGDGIRWELSKDAGNLIAENNRIENNTGAGVTCTSVRDVVIRGNHFSNNYVATLLRNDDGRGALTNILVDGNIYVGNRVYEVWGTRFPLTNVVIEGTHV